MVGSEEVAVCDIYNIQKILVYGVMGCCVCYVLF